MFKMNIQNRNLQHLKVHAGKLYAFADSKTKRILLLQDLKTDTTNT